MNPTELWCPVEPHSGTNSRLQFDITSYTQDNFGNYSGINWRIRIRGSGSKSSCNGAGLWIDGERVYFTNSSIPWSAWSDGYILATGSKSIHHNSDGNKQFSVILKQLFYYTYSDSRWGWEYNDTSFTEVVSTTVTANPIPRYPLLSLGTVTRQLNKLSVAVSNMRPGTITSWEVRKVSDNSLVTSGTSANISFDLINLIPNTNYDGIYKARAYANGGWGEYLTLNLGSTNSLPTVSTQNVGLEESSKLQFTNLNDITSWSYIMKTDNDGTFVSSLNVFTNVNNYEIILDESEISTLLGRYTTDIKPKVKLEISVVSNGISYRVYTNSGTDATIEYTIPDTIKYKPTFTVSMIGYADQNSVSLALTGSNQKIIKGISNILFTIQPMTANGGAIPVRYQVNSGSISNTGSHTGSAITILLNAVDAGNASITAIDSRGKTTTVTLNYAQFIDYSAPSIESINVRRSGGVTENLLFDVVGLFNNWSGLATTNSIQSIQYRYKEKGTATWSSYISLTGISHDGNKYSITNILGTGDLFDISTEYDVEIKVTDRLSYDTIETPINSGEPFIWKDLLNKYLGIGKKPTKMLDVAGDINTDGDMSVEGNANIKQNLHVDGNIDASGTIHGIVSGDTLPIGTQVPFTSLDIPDNWLLCDGSAISRVDYSELFTVIGTSYGSGDGSTTFNLPNKKGRTSVGLDTAQTEFNTIGKTGGSKLLQKHIHPIFRKWQGAGFAIPYSDTNADWNLSSDSGTSVVNTGETGTGNSGNLQPYETDVWIIKAKQSAGVVATVVDDLLSDSPINALSSNQGRILNEKINKQKGFDCAQWSLSSVTNISNANFTDFPGTPTLALNMSKKGSVVIRGSAVVYTSNYTIHLSAMFDSVDIVNNVAISNCMNTAGERLNFVIKLDDVDEGLHYVKLRWRTQNGVTGTALNYKNITFEVQEI